MAKAKPKPCPYCKRAIVPAGYGFWPDPWCDGKSCDGARLKQAEEAVISEALKLKVMNYTGTSYVDITRPLMVAVGKLQEERGKDEKPKAGHARERR